MKKYRYIVYILAIFCLVFINNAKASSYLSFNINAEDVKKIKIIFENFSYLEDENQKMFSALDTVVEDDNQKRKDKAEREEIIKNILDTIKKDLGTTSLFDITFREKDKIEGENLVEEEDRIFLKYKDSGLDAVLSGEYSINTKGEIELKVMLWDIMDERQILGKYYIIKKTDWKRLGHVVADRIYEGLTGENFGHFDSKILYIAETGSAKNRVKRVAIMDFDGDNLYYLTDGKNLVLTPIFSKVEKNKIFFLEYVNKDKPRIYEMDLKNGDIIKLGDFKYMTFAPNFHPKENSMLFSVAEENATNIFKMNLDNKVISKLTFEKSINTVPSYSPDGEKIVFASDRSGSRRLYVMNKDGTNVKKISFGNGIYDKPSWSPDGRLIAFVKMQNGQFHLSIMSPKGENERSLTSAYLLEGIKWSPNGRYLLYSKQRGPFGKDSIPYIYIMDILTTNEYRLPTPENEGATDPDWINK